MSAMTKYRSSDLQKIASNLKSQVRNAQLNKDKMARRVSALAFGAASAGAVGYAMGRLERKALDEGTLNTDKDPRKVASIPIPVLVGGAASALGLFAGGVTKSKKLAWVNDAVESGGSHVLAGYIYQQAYLEGSKPSTP